MSTPTSSPGTPTAASGGPAPAVGEGPLPEQRRRVLSTIVHSPGATVAEVHAQVGGHPNSVRNHLEGLVAQGLASTESRSEGPGRPPLRYSPTQAGTSVARDTSGVTATHGMSTLLEVLLDNFAERPDAAAAARALGRTWGARIASQHPLPGSAHAASAEDGVTAMLAEEGFAPVRREGCVALLRCPVLTAARAHPEVVCSLHLGMLEAAYKHHGGCESVTLEPFGAPDACLVRFTSRRQETP